MAELECRFEQEIQLTKKVNLPYLLHLPEGWDKSGEKWPLLVFLHGRDQKGDDLARLRIRGIPQLVQLQKHFHFIVLSPQCSAYYSWPFVFDGLMALIQQIKDDYPVDGKRI